jgi:hypothetical protein
VASFTISAAPWPAGQVVSVYPAEAWPDARSAPSGPSAASSAVTSAGTVAFSDLADKRRYVAYAAGQGVRFATATSGLQASVATPDRERIKLLEDASAAPAGATVDTFEPFKVIMLSDGTVRAIPADTPNPGVPGSLSALARLSSVHLSWSAPAPLTSGSVYALWRDGVQVSVSEGTSYRDIAISSGASYGYQVQTVDPYGQRSAKSSSVTAFIDPAINSAPVVTVRSWPATFPTNGRTVLRVNASDIDAQALALALSVNTGSIAATGDPSVWIYTP